MSNGNLAEDQHDIAYEKGLHERELEDKRQKHEHTADIHNQKKELFEMFKKYITWMFGIGYAFILLSIYLPSTQGAIASAIAIMLPLVIVLAMIRMLYSGETSEKTPPSVVLNVGKELASVIKLWIKQS